MYYNCPVCRSSSRRNPAFPFLLETRFSVFLELDSIYCSSTTLFSSPLSYTRTDGLKYLCFGRHSYLFFFYCECTSCILQVSKREQHGWIDWSWVRLLGGISMRRNFDDVFIFQYLQHTQKTSKQATELNWIPNTFPYATNWISANNICHSLQWRAQTSDVFHSKRE